MKNPFTIKKSKDEQDVICQDYARMSQCELLQNLLLHINLAEFTTTNRLLRAVCSWLIVSQIVLLVTALGTAIGVMFHEHFPWSGTVTGLLVGWPLAQLYVWYLRRQ